QLKAGDRTISHFRVGFLPSNVFEWHYVLLPPDGSPYYGGIYHGMLSFPSNFSFAPPGIRMFTPSGLFVPGQKICLSMSDFHPESWKLSFTCFFLLLFIHFSFLFVSGCG